MKINIKLNKPGACKVHIRNNDEYYTQIFTVNIIIIDNIYKYIKCDVG